EIAEAVGMTGKQIQEMYRLLAIAKYDDRYVIPTASPETPRGIADLDPFGDTDPTRAMDKALRIWAWAHLKHVPATVAANPARYRYCPGPVTAPMACSRHGVGKKANRHGYFRQAQAPAGCRKIHELFPASSLTPTSSRPRHFGRLRHTRWHGCVWRRQRCRAHQPRHH